MDSRISAAILVALGLYGLIGALFGVAFVSRGLARVDAAAANAGWGVRLLLWPGAAALWPWLLPRWWRAPGRPPVERTAHRLQEPVA